MCSSWNTTDGGQTMPPRLPSSQGRRGAPTLTGEEVRPRRRAVAASAADLRAWPRRDAPAPSATAGAPERPVNCAAAPQPRRSAVPTSAARRPPSSTASTARYDATPPRCGGPGHPRTGSSRRGGAPNNGAGHGQHCRGMRWSATPARGAASTSAFAARRGPVRAATHRMDQTPLTAALARAR